LCSRTPLSSYEAAAAKRDLNNVFNEIYRYTAENASLSGIKKAASNGCRLPREHVE
jgi:hypothetical protein